MKTFKLIVLLALVFLAGAVAGVVGTRMVVRHELHQAILHPDRVQIMVERRLTRQLQLDGGQQAKLHDILSGTHTQLMELRREYGPQFVLILNNANDQITAILTPEQRARFEELKRRNHVLLGAFRPNSPP